LFRIHESGSDSESFVLTESKNTDFVKIGGTEKVHGPKSRGTSRVYKLSTIFFPQQEFIESLEFLRKPAWKPFRKVIYVPTNYLRLQSYSRNPDLTPPIFSKFQLWSQI
jgi:hypothetical protein